jgi:acyl-CoA reductase-like NAD-dependent aldehyde dehydrogenase
VSAHDVINPATEEVVQTVALADAGQADAAIARAAAAQETWRAVAPADRARLLRRFAEAVDGDLENLARLEVANAGHTIGNARWEAGNVRDVLHYYAAAPERLCGRQIPVAGGIDVTFKESLGVVGVIVPWNFPMPIAGWGFEPALAAGNSVVLKPAELTPLTAIRLGELAFANSPRWARSFRPGSGPSSRHTSPVTRRSPFAASARAAPGTGIRRPCSRRWTPTHGSGARRSSAPWWR